MTSKLSFTLLLILFVSVFHITYAQENVNNRIESIKNRLELMADDMPQLRDKVSFSVSGVALDEFLRGLAINNKLNMNISPDLDTPVTINFTNVTVSDLLVYLCDQYNAEILVSGNNILSVEKYFAPPEPVAAPMPKKILITYNKDAKTISYDLHNDTLGHVLKKISQFTGTNVITTQKLQNVLVSGYVQNMDIENGVLELAHINNLSFSKDSTAFYLEEPQAKSTANQNTNVQPLEGLRLITDHNDSIISMQGTHLQIQNVLSAVTNQLKVNYFAFADLKGTVDLKIEHADFNTFLRYLFNGTDYTYKYNNGIYLIGDKKTETIRSSDVYKLQYRTTTKIMDIIPSELKKSVEIIPLPDLNSLVLSGSELGISELENFLRKIDKSVPVIEIELIIVDITKSHDIATGISAGIDKNKTTSYSSLFPNVNMTLGTNTINSIIGAINGTGLVNLGKVTSNFYLSLQASEDNGDIKIRSTPRLATLNGSEAQMTIGETRYYSEQTSNVIATQSTTTVSSTVYKPLQANLTINIKPIVSGDEQITLDIDVDQASFTNQQANNGPYGQTNRTFKSSLRVKDNDMILLGGLEEKDDNNSGSGFPILSRIPILKWIFSSRNNSAKKSKLAIFIHPTVIY